VKARCFVFEIFNRQVRWGCQHCAFPYQAPFNFSACLKSGPFPLQSLLWLSLLIHCGLEMLWAVIAPCFQDSLGSLILIRRPSLEMAPCHSSLRYGEWKFVLFDAGLMKSLSHQIPTLGLRFLGGIVFVLQLGLPVCWRDCLTYFGVEVLAPQTPQWGSWGWNWKLFLNLLSLLIVSAVLSHFCGCQGLYSLLPFLCRLFLVVQTHSHWVRCESFYSSTILPCFISFVPSYLPQYHFAIDGTRVWMFPEKLTLKFNCHCDGIGRWDLSRQFHYRSSTLTNGLMPSCGSGLVIIRVGFIKGSSLFPMCSLILYHGIR
jgi:hypothetical protein